jgi:hypothetical protein
MRPHAMHIKHIADALDSWKGWLLSRALPELRELRVVPMLTDAVDWTAAHHRLYARMLGVPTTSILLRHVPFTHGERAAYFGKRQLIALGGDVDLFLDPDTGLWRDGKRVAPEDRCKFVKTGEIGRLLAPGANRTVIVYRQGRETMTDFSTHLQSHARFIGQCYALGVRGGSVTAALFSRSRHRLNRLRHLFVSEFEPCDEARVSAVLH